LAQFKYVVTAFRFATPKLKLMLNSLNADSNPIAVADFMNELNSFFVMYSEHGNHEDNILFPTLRRFHPNLNPSMDEEHAHEHAVVAKITHAMQKWKDGNKSDGAAIAALLQVLKAELPEFLDHLDLHTRNEESTITVVARKYLTLASQKDVANRVWDLTPIDNWYTIFPYVMENLPIPMWKVRYVKTFVWANPDRAQEIGLICYRTLRSVDWAFLSKEIPEIIPRGVPGWKRIY
jgi:hemerythrin-like domain-containing protein